MTVEPGATAVGQVTAHPPVAVEASSQATVEVAVRVLVPFVFQPGATPGIPVPVPDT